MSFAPSEMLALLNPIIHPIRSAWNRSRQSPGWTVFALLFLGYLGLRLLAMTLVPLVPEEAYYWMYAQHPELSYYDHPPMVAWVIGLGTSLFGHTEFGVRIIGHLLMLAASGLMVRYGREWFSPAAGWVAAVLLQVLPVFAGVGFIATMDAALVFFWMLGLVGLTVALKDNRVGGWYVAGFALGAAMLSKYTGIFLAFGTGLALLIHPPWRKHLRTCHPYLAALLAAALFSPVIIWNAQHDWASFRFQFVDRFDPGNSLSLRNILMFALFQLMIISPIIGYAFGRISLRLLRAPRQALTPPSLLLLVFSLPLFGAMAYKSLRYGIHINWTLPAFLCMLPAVSQWFMDRGLAERVRPPLASGFAWTVMLCLIINISLAAYLLLLQPRLQWISAIGPWKQLAQIVDQYEDQLESETGREPLVIADGKYRLASVLAFYRTHLEDNHNSADHTTSQWILNKSGLGYPYWMDRNQWRGKDCLFVDDNPGTLEKTQAHFKSVQMATDPRLLALGNRTYQIAICRYLE